MFAVIWNHLWHISKEVGQDLAAGASEQAADLHEGADLRYQSLKRDLEGPSHRPHLPEEAELVWVPIMAWALLLLTPLPSCSGNMKHCIMHIASLCLRD